jgi:superfamily II DNA or RNA helicase
MVIIKNIDENYIRALGTLNENVIIKRHFTYKIPNIKFSKAYRSGISSGKISFYNRGRLPKGLYKELILFLESSDIEYESNIDLSNNLISDSSKINLPPYLKPYKHQLDIITKAFKSKREIYKSATSSGKSLAIYLMNSIFKENGLKTVIIVPKSNLIAQFYNDFKNYGCNYLDNIVKVSSKYKVTTEELERADTIIITAKSLSKYKDIISNHYSVFMIDECHSMVGPKTLEDLEYFSNIEYRYGFTGTLPDSKIDEISIIGYCGIVSNIIDTKELIELNLATPVKIKAVHLKYNLSEEDLSYKGWNEENKFIRSIDIRTQFVAKLTANFNNQNSILFLNDRKDNSLNIYRDLLISQFNIDKSKVLILDDKVSDREFITIKNLLEQGIGYKLLTTYKLASTGISIKNIHNIIFGQPLGKASTTILQTIGRGIRLHKSKKFVTIFDIIDYCKYSQDHYKNFRLKYYKESNFEILDKKIVMKY